MFTPIRYDPALVSEVSPPRETRRPEPFRSVTTPLLPDPQT